MSKLKIRNSGVFWGVSLICAALLIIVDSVGQGLGILGDIPIVRIILAIACVAWVVTELFKKRIPNIFFPLAFIFMLFQDYLAKLLGIPNDHIMSNWLVLICALLLTIGTSFIFTKKYEYPQTADSHQRTNSGNVSTGSGVKYIDSTSLGLYNLNVTFGSCEAFFENVNAYTGGGTLLVDNNFGSIEIHVPVYWHIVTDVSNVFGSVDMTSTGAVDGPVIYIRGTNRFGSIEILCG